MPPPLPSSTLFPYTTLFRSNDPPSFTLSGDVTVNEDAGAQTVHGFAGSISAGPPSESGQRLTFSTIDRKSTRLNSSHVATTYAVFSVKHTITTAADPYGTAT